nr:immunoglobulin heavy chain junction region [Macaca mulatta]MOX15363.1 immunoglobulin heavy chain junction region [Macaca mulatta]MOX15480.1 immunoglobulin heavy chain junction region [Macaca mulatta]MOX16294.1 immunoglobulin heavy chain junction region [Macaca mulatta]MOX16449.1 immunoglobulin heavy chain junction region [Macaca mulatta]
CALNFWSGSYYFDYW